MRGRASAVWNPGGPEAVEARDPAGGTTELGKTSPGPARPPRCVGGGAAPPRGGPAPPTVILRGRGAKAQGYLEVGRWGVTAPGRF